MRMPEPSDFGDSTGGFKLPTNLCYIYWTERRHSARGRLAFKFQGQLCTCRRYQWRALSYNGRGLARTAQPGLLPVWYYVLALTEPQHVEQVEQGNTLSRALASS